MATKNEQKKMEFSSGSIFFGALIGVGFLITLSVFGVAVGISAWPEGSKLPSGDFLAFLAILSVIVLTLAFFIAGFIASKVSHQQLRFDSVIHSLGTWALMAFFLMILVSLGAVAEGVQRGFSGVNPPRMMTDVHVSKATAVTTIKSGGEKSAPTPSDKQKDKIILLAWWVYFASLLCGSGTSVAGGLLGRQKFSR